MEHGREELTSDETVDGFIEFYKGTPYSIINEHFLATNVPIYSKSICNRINKKSNNLFPRTKFS